MSKSEIVRQRAKELGVPYEEVKLPVNERVSRIFDAPPTRKLTYPNKINCGRCGKRTNTVLKIKYRNFPQHGNASNRAMTVCVPCRDKLIQELMLMKLGSQ